MLQAESRPRATYPAPIDFQTLIWRMQVRGYPIASLAMWVNVPRSSMRDYAKGSSPPHHIGERIIILWEQITGEIREKAPTRHT